MSRPNFRPIAPLDVTDSELDRVNEQMGVPVMLRPDKSGRIDGKAASRQTAKTAKRQQKLTVRVPEDLVAALKRDALDRKTSVRHLLLLALQKDGYTVEAADLLPGAGGSD